jgi:hypothetical protein
MATHVMPVVVAPDTVPTAAPADNDIQVTTFKMCSLGCGQQCSGALHPSDSCSASCVCVCIDQPAISELPLAPTVA